MSSGIFSCLSNSSELVNAHFFSIIRSDKYALCTCKAHKICKIEYWIQKWLQLTCRGHCWWQPGLLLDISHFIMCLASYVYYFCFCFYFIGKKKEKKRIFKLEDIGREGKRDTGGGTSHILTSHQKRWHPVLFNVAFQDFSLLKLVIWYLQSLRAATDEKLAGLSSVYSYCIYTQRDCVCIYMKLQL